MSADLSADTLIMEKRLKLQDYVQMEHITLAVFFIQGRQKLQRIWGMRRLSHTFCKAKVEQALNQVVGNAREKLAVGIGVFQADQEN